MKNIFTIFYKFNKSLCG